MSSSASASRSSHGSVAIAGELSPGPDRDAPGDARAGEDEDEDEDESTGDEERTSIAPGSCIGRYVIRERLGAGGMGVVYLAHDPDLDRPVALKLLLSEGGRKASARRLRLLREAQAMARLSHVNVVGVLDVGEYEERVFIAMEYFEARTLDEWIEHESPSWRRILGAFQQAGRGLAAAHEAGLVHRDFKPENVLVCADGEVRVSDFGLARPVATARLSDTGTASGGSDDPAKPVRLTKTGASIGTPAYMAPEQHLKRRVDERSDQFSFCVALFEALYGLAPFEGADAQRLADSVVRGRLRQPPWDTKVPPWVWRVVRRGLIADPRERYQSMPELLDALGRDPARTRRRIIGWGVFGLMALGGSLTLADRLMPPDSRCGGGVEQLEGAWDEARREELAGVFGRADTDYAREAWRRVQAELDEYAQSWVAARRAACESTQAGGQPEALLDRRMACFERRKAALGVIVDALRTAESFALAGSVGAVANLPPVEDCVNGEELGALAHGPSVAADIERARGRLQKARALSAMSRYDDADAEVAAAMAVVERTSDPRLAAETALQHAELSNKRDDWERARASFEKAYFAALKAQDNALATDAAEGMAQVVGVRFADREGAASWLRHARAALERHGKDVSRETSVVAAEAEILESHGDYEGAARVASGGLGGLERSGVTDERLTARLHDILGKAGFDQGRLEDAKHHFEIVLAKRERLYGENHPEVAYALNNLAITRQLAGDDESALEAFHRSALVLERSLGPDHPRIGAPLANLASIYRDSGKAEEARGYEQRAYEVALAAHGPDHPATLRNRMMRAIGMAHDGDNARATAELQECVRGQERIYGDHPALGLPLSVLAQIDLDEGRFESAEANAMRAVAVIAAASGPDDPALARANTALAMARWELGRDPERAVQRLHDAMDVLRRAGFDDDVKEVVAWLEVKEQPLPTGVDVDVERQPAPLP